MPNQDLPSISRAHVLIPYCQHSVTSKQRKVSFLLLKTGISFVWLFMLLRGGPKESTAKRQQKLNSPLELHIFQPVSFLRDLIKEGLSLVLASGWRKMARPYFEVEVCWLHTDSGSSYYQNIILFLVHPFFPS